MTSFEDFKTPIFPGINDLPEEASAEAASNGSDLIKKVNGICDELVKTFPNSQITTYQIIFDPNNEIDPNTLNNNQFTSLSAFSNFITQNELTEDLIVNISGSSSKTDVLDLTNLIADNTYTITFIGDNSVSENIINCGIAGESKSIITNNANVKLIFENITFLMTQQLVVDDAKSISFKKCLISNDENYLGSINIFRRIDELSFIDCFFYSAFANTFSTALNCFRVSNLTCSKITVKHPTKRSIVINFCTVRFLNSITFVNYDFEYDVDLIFLNESNTYIDKDVQLKNINLYKKNSNVKSINAYAYEKGCFIFKFDSIENKSIALIPYPPFNYFVTEMFVKADISISNFKLLKNQSYLSVTSERSPNRKYDSPNTNDLFAFSTTNSLNMEVTGIASDITVEVIYEKY